MKTVTGRVVTTHPISLSKAASYLSKFVSSENGASQAISSYLRHASAAFKELKSLHKELKSLSFKDRIPRSAVMLEQDLTPVLEESGQPDKLSLGKRQEERENGKVGHLVDNGTEIVSRVSGTVKEEKPNHDWRRVSQGLSQEEDSKKKEGKQKKDKKTKKKNKEENKNGDDGKITRENGDKSMKVETGEPREEERNKKKKKRKNSGETDFEEKKKKKEVENENGEDKKEKKNKEENLNGDDGKIAGELEAGDKSMKVEAEEHRDEERNEKKKKRKNSGETDSEEKKSKKKRRSKGD